MILKCTFMNPPHQLETTKFSIDPPVSFFLLYNSQTLQNLFDKFKVLRRITEMKKNATNSKPESERSFTTSLEKFFR